MTEQEINMELMRVAAGIAAITEIITKISKDLIRLSEAVYLQQVLKERSERKIQ